jgi:heparan-alpha-glucosaminide N-acetyltransferase
MSDSANAPSPVRLLSLDAYRGFVMLAMASGGLGLAQMSRDDPYDNWLLDNLGYHFDHALWRGCTFWDLIQPSFLFIVGVAMPFSYENRRAQGQSWLRLFAHAVYRAALLVALGVFLASVGMKQTEFNFTNVLAQIGLGYIVVFLLLGRPRATQLLVAVLILVGYWILFAIHPRPGPGFEWADVEIYPGWRKLGGFANHWEKNVNFAAFFDRWFLNLFPRPAGQPHTFNEGGYTTLNFVPSIATMIFGVVVGEELRSRKRPPAKNVPLLIIAGAIGIIVGTVLDPQICPIVKRIWTPSWVAYSTGWACLMLVGFYWLIDVQGWRRWALPLVVVGVNSIAMYLMAQLTKGWIRDAMRTHLGQRTLANPIIESLAVMAILWLVCFWMYRRKIFLKI